MRFCVTLLVFLFIGHGWCTAQPLPLITLHLPNTNLAKIIDTLQRIDGIILSYPPHPERYHPIFIDVHNATVEEVVRAAIKGFSLDCRVLMSGNKVSVVIFPHSSSSSSSWLHSILPKVTLRPTFSNGFGQGGAVSTIAAYSTMSSEELDQVVSPDLFAHLDGRLAGLTMGGQGNGMGFSVRGNSTLLGSGSPLVVMGSLAYPGNLGDINPYDLASVNLLKDAVAAGVWGAYSGDGVLVLTPKAGDYNKELTIGLTMNTIVRARPDLSYPPRLSSASYIHADSVLFAQHFYDGRVNDPSFVVPPSVEVLWQLQQGVIAPSAASGALDAMRSHHLDDDLRRYFFRTSVTQEYHLSIEGGTPGSKYYIGAGYARDPTNLTRNQFERSTLNGTFTMRSNDDRLVAAFSGNMAAVTTLNNNPGDVPVSYPYAALADRSGRPLSVAYGYNPLFVDTIGTLSYPLDWHYRPLQELALADNRSGRLNFFLQGMASYRLFRGFSFEGWGRWIHGHSYSSNTYNKDSYFVRNLVNSFSEQHESGFTLPIPDDNILISADTNYYGYNARGLLKYCDTAAGGDKWSVMAGAEMSDAESSGQSQRFYGYNSPTSSSPMDLVDDFVVRPVGGKSTIPNNDALVGMSNRAVSVFSSAGYTWKRSYHFYSAFRLDASNIVGVANDQKWAPFWSVGMSRGVKRRNGFLNVRMSLGCNGNVSNRTADLVTSYLGLNGYGARQSGIVGPPDPTLGWERVYVFNAGVDYQFFRDSVYPRGRLSGSLDLYQRWAVNLLSNDTLAPSAGTPAYMGNSAGIIGQGIDLVLRSVNVAYGHPRFFWTSVLLLSFNRDWINKYPYEPKSPAAYVTGGFMRKGRPSTALFSYGWAGLDPLAGNPQGWLGGSPSTNYSALMNDPTASILYSGNWQPTVTASLLNSFELGHWVLSVRLDCRTNYIVRRPSIEYYYLAQNFYGGTRDYDDRWQFKGQHTSVPSQPAAPDANRDLFYAYSQVLVVRADNIRLRDVKLSYGWTPRHGPFKSVVIYGFANNLGMLWRANHFGIDPDAAVYGEMPAPRVFALGAHLVL